MKDQIYLDYAAATPMDDVVYDAMKPYLHDKFYNPSALYLASKAVRADLEAARSTVSRIIGARPGEVIFTAGATESINLAIKGLMDLFPQANMVTSAIEHDAVNKTAEKYDHKTARVSKDGIIDLGNLESLIDDTTVLISVMYANNEIGTIQPIKQIAEIVKKIRLIRQKNGSDLPLYLHTDAAQAANYLDINVAGLGVDMMSLNGGKIYGPKQSGILYIRAGMRLSPQITGGGQEMGLRSGTENVAGCIGFAKALEITVKKSKAESKRLMEMRDYLIKNLENIEGIRISGSKKHRLPNNINAVFDGCDNERLVMELDEKGIQCAVGSACHASSGELSSVLKAIGLDDKDVMSSVRFSLGRGNKVEHIDRLIDSLKETS